MITGDIAQAVIDEIKELFSGTGATIIRKTDFKVSKMQTYGMPLMLLDIVDAPDTFQYPGGLSRVDFVFAMNCFNYMPDSYNDDSSGYSNTGTDAPLDQVRQHFSIGTWLTQGMTDIRNNYGFRFTLSGIVPADALDQDGLILGYRIMFDSIAFDPATSQLEAATGPVTTVTQLNNPPFN